MLVPRKVFLAAKPWAKNRPGRASVLVRAFVGNEEGDDRGGGGGAPSGGPKTLLPLDDPNLGSIFDQNEAWRQEMQKRDPAFFAKLGAGHKPRYLWIGCADARVPANELINEGPGTIFVHRNVGNQVLSTDMSLQATLQYAVDYLEVPHIIVCGHYDCGAVKAASTLKNHAPPLENWLTTIRDVKRMHRAELLALPDAEAQQRRLVELNVIESVLNVHKVSCVQRRRVATFNDPSHKFTAPRIHAVVFDPSVGRLERLRVNFQALLEEYSDVYDMYGAKSDKAVAAKAAAEVAAAGAAAAQGQAAGQTDVVK